jgi:hypothetical protein
MLRIPLMRSVEYNQKLVDEEGSLREYTELRLVRQLMYQELEKVSQNRLTLIQAIQ